MEKRQPTKGNTRYQQQPPFTIQVELSLGCNLGCSFCGINGIEFEFGKNGFYLMTVETAEAIAKNIADAGWTSRIEFARRGEPTMNPDMVEIVRQFRKHLPHNSIMMTSNGGGLLPKKKSQQLVSDLFDAGLNVLAIDDYDTFNIVPKLRSVLDDENYLEAANITKFEYPKEKDGNPHKRRKPKERHLVFIRDIVDASEGTHSRIENHAGYAFALQKYMKPCAKPFRELSVNWDGTVNHCCIAWAGEMVVGNAATMPLEELWQSDRFYAVRQKLLQGERDFGTCNGCNHHSMRPGLLPDKHGKDKDQLPPPSEWTEEVLRQMESEGFQVEPTERYFKNRKIWE